MADGRVLLIFLQIEGAWVRLCKSRAGASPSGGGRRCKGKSFASGRGRRYKGISSAAWLRVLLQHAGAVHPCTARTKSPCSDVLRDRGGPGFGEAWQSRHRRSHGPSVGERRGGAGIGRKQAMDGLCSPVGARDGATRRCARSPRHRGSPRRRQVPALWLKPEARITATPHEASGLRRFSAWPDPHHSLEKNLIPGLPGGPGTAGSTPRPCVVPPSGPG